MSDQATRDAAFQQHLAAFDDRIAPYQSGRARIDYYVAEPRELRITVHNDEDTCVILCKRCRSFQMNGSLEWNDCRFTIRPQPYNEHLTDVVLADARVGFAVWCSEARVIVSGEIGFQSKQMAALVVLDQMPLVVHELRHYLGSLTGALGILRTDPSRFKQPFTPDIRAQFLEMAWTQSNQIRDEVDRLLASTAYRGDADDTATQEATSMNDEANRQQPTARDVAGHITSIIGHELKNPLATIHAIVHVLQRMDGVLKEDRDELLTTALRCIERAHAVTGDIMAYCRAVSTESR